jgi:PPM family protein phosphatase
MEQASWTLSWAGGTDKGKVRQQNQDSFYIDPNGRFMILADGMGGHSGGEIASQRTVEAVREALEAIDWLEAPSAQAVAELCVSKANHSLQQWVEDHPEHADLGTTLLIWIRVGAQIYLVSLGDSRIYLYRQEGLFLLTFDQVIENELRKKGVSREQAARSQGAAYLSRCILANRICVPDVLETKISQGDVWLLCSDGLTREVASDEISAALDAVRSDGPEACVEVLIQKAVNNGGRDNVTVVIAHFAD